MRIPQQLLVLLFCLATPTYAPELRGEGSERQETEQQEPTVAPKEQLLESLLATARQLREAKQFVKAIQALNSAGDLQRELSLKEQAIATFREAIILSEQNNYLPGKGEALLLLSNYQNELRLPEAIENAREASAIFTAIDNKDGIVRSQLTIGTIELSQTRLAEATESFENAKGTARAFGLSKLHSEAVISLGMVAYRKGEWQDVFELMREAESLIDGDADPEMMGKITAILGDTFLEIGLPEIALAKYQEAIQYYKDYRSGVTGMTCSIGKAHFFSGHYSEALVSLDDAVAKSAAQQSNWLATSHEFLGRTYAATNDYPRALDHLQQALNLYPADMNPMEVARIRVLIGQVYEMSGKLDTGREFYQEALQAFASLSDVVNKSASQYALGRLELKSGNYELAEVYLRDSIDATEKLRQMTTSSDLTTALSPTVHDRYEQYIHCLMRSGDGGIDSERAIRAFETSESARARTLSELLLSSGTDPLASLDPELSKQEQSLRQQIRVNEEARLNLFKRKFEQQELRRFQTELDQLRVEHAKILNVLNERYPAYGQITQPQRTLNLRMIQTEVIRDADTVLLEYFLGADKSYVWIVTRDSFKSRELPARAAVDRVVQTVRDLLQGPVQADTDAKVALATQELAQMIMVPIDIGLNIRRLIVVPDDSLNYIPFQVLPVAANTREPLVARYEIINAPSASILGQLRAEAASRGGRSKTLAAIGNPEFSLAPALSGTPQSNEQVSTARKPENDHLRYALRDLNLNGDIFDLSVIGPLFYAGREIANLEEIASPAETFTATGFAATRDQLRSMDLSQYAILHLATHGLLNPKRPEHSGLVFSLFDRQGHPLEGFVNLQDVYSLRAPVDLVVLSACQTGLGDDVRGEGLVGLTRGFMYAGAGGVVASLWKVDDEATAELMKRFYIEMLKNDKPPAEALRAAQNTIRKIPGWSAPHYWAAFTFQGDYRYVVNSSRYWHRYKNVLVVGVLLILVASADYLHGHRPRKATRR